MTIGAWLLFAIALAVAAYLTYVMLRPERF